MHPVMALYVVMTARAEPAARRWVLHLDLDQFIAAVEILRRPELEGLPVIVGGRGDPSERAVVATASYAAREFGVRSGMPLRLAARKCPQAVLLPVDGPAYTRASEQVFAALRAVPDVIVEPLGWDECFLGITAADPEPVARALQQSVLANTHLHCSIGIGDNRIRAKNATDFGKPRGTFTLTAQNWMTVMGARAVRELWGIGPRVSERLGRLDIHTVEDLAGADREPLLAEFGPRMGTWYAALGRGEGSAEVDDTPWVARSHSRETTYQENLRTPAQIRAAVGELVAAVVADCAAEGLAIVRVGLKVRYAPFFTRQWTRKLPAPTTEATPLLATLDELLAALEPGREVRLLGVRGEMKMPPEPPQPLDRTPVRGRV